VEGRLVHLCHRVELGQYLPWFSWIKVKNNGPMHWLMSENWVRGDVFMQVLGYVKKKRGNAGLAVTSGKKKYNTEQTYGFPEFCDLLYSVKMAFQENGDFIITMARETMIDDPRWRLLFQRLSPMEVFTSTQRQEGRHQVGVMTTEATDDNTVIIVLELDEGTEEQQDIWSEFNIGRLEGILKLTGREGTVKPERSEGPGSYAFTVNWD